jgi:L-threonylcarbamoyladenylate synthase
MKVVKKKEFLENIDFYINEINDGKIFIFPTDTIYGIGCIANNSSSIEKVRKAKKRDKKPLAIIAPSKEWVYENYILEPWAEEYLDKLPGKYTFILEFKSNKHISPEINIYDNENGVRIPDIWFSDVVSKLGTAFVATSVNISGEPNIAKLEDLDEYIAEHVDYFIDDGELGGEPSKIYNLRTSECIRLR